MKKLEDEIQRKTQIIWENHKVALLIAIITIPLIVQIMFGIFNIISEIAFWNVKFPDSSNWIGFWGSYLGVIPSGLIAYWVAKYQVQSDKEQQQEEHEKRFRLDALKNIYTESTYILTKLQSLDSDYAILKLMKNNADFISNNASTNRDIIMSNFTINEIHLIIENIGKIISDIDIYETVFDTRVFDDSSLNELRVLRNSLMKRYTQATAEGAFEDDQTGNLYNYTETYLPWFMEDIEKLEYSTSSVKATLKNTISKLINE